MFRKPNHNTSHHILPDSKDDSVVMGSVVDMPPQPARTPSFFPPSPSTEGKGASTVRHRHEVIAECFVPWAIEHLDEVLHAFNEARNEYTGSLVVKMRQLAGRATRVDELALFSAKINRENSVATCIEILSAENSHWEGGTVGESFNTILMKYLLTNWRVSAEKSGRIHGVTGGLLGIFLDLRDDPAAYTQLARPVFELVRNHRSINPPPATSTMSSPKTPAH